MKKRSRTLAVFTFIILLIVAAIEFAMIFLLSDGKCESRGDLKVGPVCFSAFEVILLILLLVAAIAGGVCVYTLCKKRTKLMYQFMDALGETYLRIVRINYMTGIMIIWQRKSLLRQSGIRSGRDWVRRFIRKTWKCLKISPLWEICVVLPKKYQARTYACTEESKGKNISGFVPC